MYSANAEYMEYKCRIRVMQNTHRIQTQNTCHLVFCVFCMYSYMYSTCADTVHLQHSQPPGAATRWAISHFHLTLRRYA